MIGEFCLVNCAIWSSLCVFYVSQSELRHLQCIVCVCVCVWSCVKSIQWASGQGSEYGCIEFEADSSTCSSPGAKFVEQELRKSQKTTRLWKQPLFTKNSDDIRGRAIYNTKSQISILWSGCAIYCRYLVVFLSHALFPVYIILSKCLICDNKWWSYDIIWVDHLRCCYTSSIWVWINTYTYHF